MPNIAALVHFFYLISAAVSLILYVIHSLEIYIVYKALNHIPSWFLLMTEINHYALRTQVYVHYYKLQMHSAFSQTFTIYFTISVPHKHMVHVHKCLRRGSVLLLRAQRSGEEIDQVRTEGGWRRCWCWWSESLCGPQTPLIQIPPSRGGKWCLTAFNCIMFFLFFKLHIQNTVYLM